MSEVVQRPLDPGAMFLGRYQVVRCIKAGGMGAVYTWRLGAAAPSR
jgi:hypothetical protein